MANYYNEFDPYAAQWLRNLIKAGHIPDGEVDTRSIVDVQPDDLRGFRQAHFFCGIAGWPLALKLANWNQDREIWTGSCPCQPFSVAGKGKGTDDDRHLWPHFHRLISACRPAVVMGEQVSGKAGADWFDGICSDLESQDYSCEALDVPALGVNGPHIRQRIYWFAKNLGHADNAGSQGYQQPRDMGLQRDTQSVRPTGTTGLSDSSECGDMANANGVSGVWGEYEPERRQKGRVTAGWSRPWDNAEWVKGIDGKARRVGSGVRLLAHGVPNRVGRLRAYGNAIVPPLAAEIIKAFMDTEQ
jgi:DNA (cytosine-5)-methyltransferase 1